MYNEKVTIVIPTYNGEKYIVETIESCLNQTYKNLNIIIIDDNSTDNTLVVLEPFNNMIKIIANKINQGLPKNINQVILNDDSDYFIYLGHDDIIPVNHVEIMLKEFDNDTVAVHCNSMAIDSNGEKMSFTRNNKIQFEKTNDLLYQLSIDNFISVIGMMNRTKSFKKILGWDESYDLYGEWLYYIRVAKYGKVKYTENTYAFYRIHENNISNSLHVNKSKLRNYYEYKRRCRELAHQHSKKTILKELYYLKCYFFNYLRYKKALLKSRL